jgi:hypothetical protein
MTQSSKVVKQRAMIVRMDLEVWRKFRSKVDKMRMKEDGPGKPLPSAQTVILGLIKTWLET